MSRAIWTSAALCVVGASTARGAPLDLTDVEDVETLSLAELLERPVVTASRYAQKPASTPLLVSTVDAEQFEAMGYRTVGDALRSMRGVYLTNDRNYSYIGSRGFSIPGDYNTRFALAIDGHPINDPVYGQATPGLELGLPLIAIDHVELLRGGAWSVYGPNALFGAIQIVTATGASRPGLVVRTTANATAETFHDPADRPAMAPRAQDVSASYGTVARGVDVFAAAQYTYDPGLAALHMPELAGPEGACVDNRLRPRVCDGVVVGGDAEELGSTYVAMRGKRFGLRALASSRRKQTPTAAYGALVGDPIQTVDRRLFADATYGVRDKRGDLDIRVSVDNYDYRGRYPYEVARDGYESLPASRVVNRDLAVGTWVSGEIRGRLVRRRWGKHLSDLEIAAGLEGQVSEGLQRNLDPFPEGTVTYIDITSTGRRAAATAHASGRAFDRVVGFAAVRADHSSTAKPDVVVNPQLGLVLDLEELGRVRASLGRGFRAPNLYERDYVTSSQAINRSLSPERSETRELSVEHYLNKRTRVIAGAYHQTVSDLIALTTLDDGTRIMVNEGTSTGYGLEAEVEARWDTVQLRASYSWQHAHDEQGEERVNAPHALGAATMLVRLGPSASLGLETTYVGSRRTLDGGAIQPAFLTTASLTLREIAEDLDLTIGTRNLFDVRTFSAGSEEHRQARIPDDPRTIWIQLTARIGKKKGALP